MALVSLRATGRPRTGPLARTGPLVLTGPLALAVLFSGCLAEIGDPHNNPDTPGRDAPSTRPDATPPRADGGPGVDGGPESDAGLPEGCGPAKPAIVFFEDRCARACHRVDGTFPLLTRDGLSELLTLESRQSPGTKLVVPNDPDASWLYRKMAGTQGPTGQALMPLGVSAPIAELSIVDTWIRQGAPTVCEEPIEPPEVEYDPNTLDQGALFTCSDATAPRSSPSRLRRIERQELTRAALRRTEGRVSAMTENPFTAPARARYSTYTDDYTIDASTLDLYLLNMSEATANWIARDPAQLTPAGQRLEGVYNNQSVRCIFQDATPNDACVDEYISILLSGTLFRTPRADEASRLKALLAAGLTEEAGDVAQRTGTLSRVASAAYLMTGTLFRSEIGAPTNDGRLALDDEELALALGHVLSTHPVGVRFPIAEPYADDPDEADPSNGRLGAIYRAAEDGSIQDPAVRRALIRKYGGGLSDNRPDLRFDHRNVSTRGSHWLAHRFIGFFREFFDYEGAGSAFKDDPGATSEWDGSYTGNPMYDPTKVGYTNLQEASNGSESTLVQQLDDTIARIVVESDQQGFDVFEALMNSTHWHLPSNLATTNGVSCTQSSDCTAQGYTNCSPIGLCASSTWKKQVTLTRAYSIDHNVPTTRAGRWVDMPANERRGVLTHPAWLAAHGGNFEDDASLVHRGKWIREKLFSQTVPPLELVMVEAKLIPSAPDLSARERVTKSTEEGEFAPTCMGCHSLMNSLGMPFEAFNHAGFVRETDHGAPPDGSTVIDNLPDPSLNRAYANPLEFVQAIGSSAYARRGFIRHAFRYFVGREETMADACTLAEMEQALDQTGSFFSMIEALVSSATFTHRTIEGDE